jgi:hypothetical protein
VGAFSFFSDTEPDCENAERHRDRTHEPERRHLDACQFEKEILTKQGLAQ